MGETWSIKHPDQAQALIQFIKDNKDADLQFKLIRGNRTSRQNDALHTYLREVARHMEAAGLDMKTVIKDGVPITPDERNVKKEMWMPIQRALTNKESTTELDTKEVNEVYQHMSRVLVQKYGIDVPFGRGHGY